jgi:hypothetical protein
LVNINNDNLLTKIITYWNDYTDNFVIVINSEYTKMVDYYMKLLKVNFKIVEVDIGKEENSYTIKKSIGTEYYNKNILMTWCDIYPNEKIKKSIFGDKNIIFTFGNECRYKAINNKLYKEKDGNVIGIYYFYKYKPLIIQQDNMDLCDCYLDNYDNFETYNLLDLIDIGDMTKYMNIYNEHKDYKTRAFNVIKEENNKLIKKAINEQGRKIIEKEMKWYKVNDIYNFVPKIHEYNENSFVMEKLEGYEPLFTKFGKMIIEEKNEILDKILENLEKLHINERVIETTQLDLDYEFRDKITERYIDIHELLKCFEIKYINGLKIEISLTKMLDELNHNIFEYFKGKIKYSIIHGDCQFSNILFKDSEIKFIDPRGYFGNTLIYGLKEYDYSKIVYALTGYDEFNNNLNYLNIKDENISIDVNIDLESIKYISEKKNIPLKILLDMAIIHWLGLAQYNKNNITKCINSYYTGIYLFIKSRQTF